jgi:serine/threonine-protein kinase RsbW
VGGKYTLVIKAELAKLDEIRQFVESSAKSLRAESRVVPDLQLAVDEAVTNIIIHGYQKAQGKIEISIDQDADALIVCLRDTAPEFNPNSYVESDLTAPPEREVPGGFGIRLIKQLMDEVSYRAPDSGGNELTLIKHNLNQ